MQGTQCGAPMPFFTVFLRLKKESRLVATLVFSVRLVERKSEKGFFGFVNIDGLSYHPAFVAVMCGFPLPLIEIQYCDERLAYSSNPTTTFARRL